MTATILHNKSSYRFRRIDRWAVAAIVMALVLFSPILAIVWVACFPEENIWPHLFSTALLDYLSNTFVLMVAVAIGTAVVGSGTGWLVSNYCFPGHRIFEWVLLAPLAVPAYIAAYTIVDLLEYAGPVQTALRAMVGWERPGDYWFPEIRSRGGAAVVMTFAFYPYVYMLSRVAFAGRSAAALEVARSLGCGPWGALFRVALPLARPAIVAGVALALMETLNDFGAVDYFAVPTLTVGVFSIWFEAFNPGGAAQIALVMLVLVFGLVAIERRGRRGARYQSPDSRFRPSQGRALRPAAGWLACLACSIPVLIGFVVPVGILLRHAVFNLARWDHVTLLTASLRTAILASVAATIGVAVGILLVYGIRTSHHRAIRHVGRIASLGYAIPGVVLAIGILFPLLQLDRLLGAAGITTGLVFGGSLAGVVFAYVVRFMAVPYYSTDAGFANLPTGIAMAARTLGASRGGALWRVQLPLLRGSLLAAWLLVFVESVKELPATLVLRPFAFDTLATHVHTYASLEQLETAAPAALAIVVVGLVPTILLRASLRQGLVRSAPPDPC